MNVETLEEYQKLRQPWWPKDGSKWKGPAGRCEVVGISVLIQTWPEFVVMFKDRKGMLWTQTLRSFLREYEVAK